MSVSVCVCTSYGPVARDDSVKRPRLIGQPSHEVQLSLAVRREGVDRHDNGNTKRVDVLNVLLQVGKSGLYQWKVLL